MEMYVRCMSGACMYAEGKEEDSHRQDKRWRTSTKNACAGGCSRVYDLNGGQISVLGYHSVDRRRAPRQPPTRKQSRPYKQNTISSSYFFAWPPPLARIPASHLISTPPSSALLYTAPTDDDIPYPRTASQPASHSKYLVQGASDSASTAAGHFDFR